jgi:hypothetical protein
MDVNRLPWPEKVKYFSIGAMAVIAVWVGCVLAGHWLDARPTHCQELVPNSSQVVLVHRTELIEADHHIVYQCKRKP